MPKPHSCRARCYGNQMICAPCQMTWDTNDTEPPECRKIDLRLKVLKQVDKESAPVTKSKGLPAELPRGTVVDMDKAYVAAGGGIPGMRAAYRLFLDRSDHETH